MIELHHGSINVESRLNKGTRFFIKLPLQKTLPNLDSIPKPKALSWNLKQKESPSKAPILREVFEYKHTLSSKKTNVLIVEDNPEVKEFIKSIFQPHYEVFTAANGVDALKEAIKVLPDLIISDVMMPEMDGIELCKRIKSEIHTSHIPVLLLTAKTSPMNKLTGLDSGADDYITKPFLPDELLLKSRNIINSRRQLREKYSPKINLEPSEITFTSIDEHFLLDAIKAVERNMENPLFDTNKFASEMAVSRSVLFSKLKALINETPNNFTKTIRLKRAAQLFEQGKFKVSEVCYKVGFNDKKYFSKCFAKMYGQTPTKYMEAKRILNTKE
jgi:DNA-binding response OmpR family regulator